MPATAKNLTITTPSPLLELCVFTFYQKSRNLTTQVDPLFLPAVVPPNLFPTSWKKLWHLSFKLYHLTLRTANAHLTLVSSAKTNLFLLWILHLFLLSFPMTKVALNCFSFSGNYYKQSNGVAMGTKTGPSYANLFVGFIERQFFNQYHGPKPELYGRYIDDCIGATSSTREELTHFMTV